MKWIIMMLIIPVVFAQVNINQQEPTRGVVISYPERTDHCYSSADMNITGDWIFTGNLIFHNVTIVNQSILNINNTLLINGTDIFDLITGSYLKLDASNDPITSDLIVDGRLQAKDFFIDNPINLNADLLINQSGGNWILNFELDDGDDTRMSIRGGIEEFIKFGFDGFLNFTKMQIGTGTSVTGNRILGEWIWGNPNSANNRGTLEKDGGITTRYITNEGITVLESWIELSNGELIANSVDGDIEFYDGTTLAKVSITPDNGDGQSNIDSSLDTIGFSGDDVNMSISDVYAKIIYFPGAENSFQGLDPISPPYWGMGRYGTNGAVIWLPTSIDPNLYISPSGSDLVHMIFGFDSSDVKYMDYYYYSQGETDSFNYVNITENNIYQTHQYSTNNNPVIWTIGSTKKASPGSLFGNFTLRLENSRLGATTINRFSDIVLDTLGVLNFMNKTSFNDDVNITDGELSLINSYKGRINLEEANKTNLINLPSSGEITVPGNQNPIIFKEKSTGERIMRFFKWDDLFIDSVTGVFFQFGQYYAAFSGNNGALLKRFVFSVEDGTGDGVIITPKSGAAAEIPQALLDVRGNVKINKTLDVVENITAKNINSSNNVFFNVTDEITMTVDRFKLPGTNPPSEAIISLTPVLKFDKNTNESIYGSMHVIPQYNPQTAWEVTFYWSPTDATTNTVLWCIESRCIQPDNDETLTDTATIFCIEDDSQGLQDEILKSDKITIPGTGTFEDDQCNFRVYRGADHINDDYDNDASLISTTIYYNAHKLGEI